MRGTYTHYYDELPRIARILIQIFAGGIVGGIYRIARYFETRNTTTLLVGILATFTGLGNMIAWIVDLVTTLTQNDITVCAD